MAESEEESFIRGALDSAECRGTLYISSVTHSSCQAPCSSNDILCDSGAGKFSSKKLK